MSTDTHSSKAVLAALKSNFFIAITKTAGAFLTGSASMIAESIHSFADTGNQLLLLLGSKKAQKKSSSDHPLGHGKETYFWSFIVSLVLFGLGGVYSIYEGFHKFMNPEPLEHTGYVIGILFLGFVFELKSFKVCLAEIKIKYPGKSFWWFFHETRDPDLLIVFGEDLAALFGLGLASMALFISILTGNPVFDAIGSILIGLLLTVVSVFLFSETKALLIGQSADPEIRKGLRSLISSMNEIEHTYECITQQYGAKSILLLRVRMTEKEDAQKLIADINQVEKKINENFPLFSIIFVEPDNNSVDF